MTHRRYPVGVRSFVEIRQGGYAYVDKTALVHRLANESEAVFFLNRPPQFGKSLLVSTLQAYFEGRRELFGGLAIEKLETVWEPHPVIRLDLSAKDASNPESLRDLLDAELAVYEGVWGRGEAMKTPGSRLMSLIRRACLKSGKPVVVLVDGYDAPLLGVLGDGSGTDPEVLPALWDALVELFSLLKACDECLRFGLITGVTKFVRLDTSGCLNSLVDISAWSDYATVCGVTEEELESQLGRDVAEFGRSLGVSDEEALDILRRRCGGYRFALPSPAVCNPYGLFAALRDGVAGSFRSEAEVEAEPSAFLPELPKGREWDVATFEAYKAREGEFDAPDRRLEALLPMLYQGGYLTLKSYDPASRAFTLGIPNEGARRALTNRERFAVR